MATPWFEPNTFGAWYGSIVGGAGGSLGGLLGAAAGRLAPQGKGRRWILGGMRAFVLIGITQIVFGLVALLSGQPYGIWYGPLLVGCVFTVVCGSLIPTVRRRYEEAEQRRIDAGGLRRG